MSQQSIQQLLWYFTQDQNRRSTDQKTNRFCDSVVLLAHVDIFIVWLCVLRALISRVYDQDQCESHSAWHTCHCGTCRDHRHSWNVSEWSINGKKTPTEDKKQFIFIHLFYCMYKLEHLRDHTNKCVFIGRFITISKLFYPYYQLWYPAQKSRIGWVYYPLW